MRRSTLVAVLVASAVTMVVLPRDIDTVSNSTEVDVLSQLPPNVRILLAGGLCDNIQGVFMSLIRDFPHLPQDRREEAFENIEYYRDWLRKKNCG